MTAFVDAAFGDDPGRWPLPAAVTPRERWLRAVSAGGQGRYSAALAELDALGRTLPAGPLSSMVLSTRASFRRQLGDHRDARSWDGRAWAAAGSDVEAGVDALVGLAADALGVGRFSAAHRLLQRAADLLGTGATGRLPVRLAWVNAELAMFTGDGATSVGHAERAVDLAARLGSVRHRLKSQVVLAAAQCSAGRLDVSRQVADDALADSDRLGLVPLSWALSCLLADIGSSVSSPTEIRSARDAFAHTILDRGGTWTAR